MHAADRKPRMLFAHLFRCQLGNAGLATEQIHTLSVLRQHTKQPIRKIDACNLLLQRRFQNLRRQHHARAVRQNKVRLIQKRPEAFIPQSLVCNLRVRRDRIAGFVTRKNFSCPLQRLLHCHVVKRNSHDVRLHTGTPSYSHRYKYFTIVFCVCPSQRVKTRSVCFTFLPFGINCSESHIKGGYPYV